MHLCVLGYVCMFACVYVCMCFWEASSGSLYISYLVLSFSFFLVIYNTTLVTFGLRRIFKNIFFICLVFHFSLKLHRSILIYIIHLHKALLELCYKIFMWLHNIMQYCKACIDSTNQPIRRLLDWMYMYVWCMFVWQGFSALLSISSRVLSFAFFLVIYNTTQMYLHKKIFWKYCFCIFWGFQIFKLHSSFRVYTNYLHKATSDIMLENFYVQA